MTQEHYLVRNSGTIIFILKQVSDLATQFDQGHLAVEKIKMQIQVF